MQYPSRTYATLQRKFMARVFVRLQELTLTQAEIGAVWGLGRERVRQILVGV